MPPLSITADKGQTFADCLYYLAAGNWASLTKTV